jgi:hypothetical protein
MSGKKHFLPKLFWEIILIEDIWNKILGYNNNDSLFTKLQKTEIKL